ncbi:MAG: DUF934 domain-containing protein [Amylibacter sp.]
MVLLKDGAPITDDWLDTSTTDAVLETDKSSVIYTLEDWQERRDELSKRNGPNAIILPNDVLPDVIAGDLDNLSMVVVIVPTFKDGRAYSQVRRLRERLGFKGDIRVTGDVLVDQFAAFHRLGANILDLKKDKEAALWSSIVGEVSNSYQHAIMDKDQNIPRQRQKP